MSRASVVPWWGRLLPWVCLFVAVGCFSWSLGIDGWRLTVFVLGLAAHVGGHEVRKANDEATREIK